MNAHDSGGDNPKKAYGDAKPSAHFFPSNVLFGVYEVMRQGAAKYGLKNWRKQPIRASTYYDAIDRHLKQWFELGEDADIESKRHHLEHIIAGASLVLDSIERGILIDDREQTEVLTAGVGNYHHTQEEPHEPEKKESRSERLPTEVDPLGELIRAAARHDRHIGQGVEPCKSGPGLVGGRDAIRAQYHREGGGPLPRTS